MLLYMLNDLYVLLYNNNYVHALDGHESMNRQVVVM